MGVKRSKDIGGERNVAVLLEQYGAEVNELRAACVTQGLSVNEKEHDDVYLLRFLLSWGSVDAAAKAVADNLNYRQENASWLPKPGQEMKDFEHYGVLGSKLPRAHHGSTATGDRLVLVRSGVMDMPHLFKMDLPEDALPKFFTFSNEVMYQKCDRITRDTGRLCKMLLVNDMCGVTWGRFDVRLVKALGKSSKVSDVIHPQLSSRNIFVHPPAILRALFKIAKPLVSKNTWNKLAVCTASRPWGAADIGKCPFVAANTPLDTLPTFLGGHCECTGGCVPGWPNELSKKAATGVEGKE